MATPELAGGGLGVSGNGIAAARRPAVHTGALFLTGALAAALALPGCSLGFRNLHPGEEGRIYDPLFSDIINRFDSPEWLWVRGVISGDFDADGDVAEEAVVATIQKGNERAPGGIDSAYLAICRLEPNGGRTAIARAPLFDGNPVPRAARPDKDAGGFKVEPLRSARAQVVQNKSGVGDSVMVFAWGESSPTSVWYALYRLRDGMLEKIFETALWQDQPGFATENLDKRAGSASPGYQMVFPVSGLPLEVVEKLGGWREAPVWGHVYGMDENGVYRQADELFGENYARIENQWNQSYLKAILYNFENAELAWFEYHLGMLNHYAGKRDIAARLFDKAGANAADAALLAAIAKARDILGQPVGRAGKVRP